MLDGMDAPVCLAFPLEGHGVHTRVLLGRKQQGFGSGRLVGVGGHVEQGETTRAAAVRETWEETGLAVDPDHLEDAGEVAFHFPTHPEWDMTVALFRTRRWTGEVRASSELEPQWHCVADIPWARMWDDSRIWLPYVLGGASVRADITYNTAGDRVAHLALDVS